jgi:hypothetical protein
LFLRAWRAAGPHPLASPANLQFVLALSLAWIAAIESLNVASCERINREHAGSMAVLASVCVASGAAALLLTLLGIALPGMGNWPRTGSRREAAPGKSTFSYVICGRNAN